MNNSQFSVLFQQAANGNTGNAEIFADNTSLGTFNYGDPLAEHSVLINLTPATSGAYGATDSIGYSVSVDGGTAITGVTTGGAQFGDLAFGTSLFSAPYIDNLTVNAVSAVPEPSCLALLGLGGLAMVSRRRR